jgi:osmoprotectant transport system permease protein
MAGRPLIDWSWIVDHVDDIWFRTVQHLGLALIAIVAGFLVSFALSLAIRQIPRLYSPVTTVSGVLYTIPSLALFAALVPVTGLTILTAEIPLVIYTLLIYVRNIVAGFQSVPPDVLEAADAMGFTRARRLRSIEIPLAIPFIVSGIRIVSVSTIGLVMIVSVIGNNFGGLGLFIKEGIQTFFPTKIYVGTVMSLLLAFGADALFVLVERAITPWSRARAARAIA